MGRLMLLEYARFCFTAMKRGLPMPDLPTVFLSFLATECKSAGVDTAELMYIFGTLYANGLGVPENEGVAYTWLSRAAALGNGHAMYAVSGSSEERLRIAAARGSPHACVELATLPIHLDESWLVKALVLAPFDAQSRKLLATHYEKTGRIEAALIHHQMLARQGHADSTITLAKLYCNLSVATPKYLIPCTFWACRAAPSPAKFKTQAIVALRLNRDETAFDCMKKAAVGSCAASTDALYELARFYEQGVGTVIDKECSEKLLARAAKAGQPSAQFDMAMKHLHSDPTEAMNLVRSAAKTHVVSMHFLSRYDSRRELLETAGEFIPAALFDLAVRYASTADLRDTAQNYLCSIRLLEKALSMPPPVFECNELDVAKTESLLSSLRKRVGICESLQMASMDSLLRLTQSSCISLLTDTEDGIPALFEMHLKPFMSYMALLDAIELKL